MSNVPQYPFYGRLAAGKRAVPEVIALGSAAAVGKMLFTTNLVAGDEFTINGYTVSAVPPAAPAVGKIVFTGNLIAGDTVTINGYTFHALASGATEEWEFDVDTTLSLSLDNLVDAANACTDDLVTLATYSKTDTNTALTMTCDTNEADHNNIILATNHSTAVITQPTGGSDEPTATQFEVAGTLSLSLDALVSLLNGITNAAVNWATYSKTDTNAALTITADAVGSARNSVVIHTTHSPVTLTQMNGGMDIPRASLNCEHTRFNQAAANTISVYLDDGEEGQVKTFANIGLGTINLTSPNDMLPGSTNQYALNGADALVLQWLAGKWRLVLNDGCVAS